MRKCVSGDLARGVLAYEGMNANTREDETMTKPSPMPEYLVNPPMPYEATHCATHDDARPCGTCAWCRFTTQILGRSYRSLCTQEG